LTRCNVAISYAGAQAAHDFDRAFWVERWSKALREHAGQVAQRPPNTYLTAAAGSLAPGRALDAGCGLGAETLWLAADGRRVTAVDFSATVLAHARSTAATFGPDIAERIHWTRGTSRCGRRRIASTTSSPACTST